MSHYIDRRGETKRAKNGLMMKIIAYRNVHDIDIQFEDGYTVTHKSYSHFKEGCVRHPKHTIISGLENNRQTKKGETSINTAGQAMTIKEYNNHSDIIVEFEGGVTARTNYRAFKKGYVKNPVNTENKKINEAKKKYIDKVMPCKLGGMMKCIDYVDNNNLTVEFEDGTRVVTNAFQFKAGTVKKPNILKDKYVEFETYTTCGLKMKCIECEKTSDATVEFEDGTIVRHKFINNIIAGKVPHPAFNRAGTAIQKFIAGDYIIKGLAYIDPVTKAGEFYCYKESSPDIIEIKNIKEMKEEFTGKEFFPCKFSDKKKTNVMWTESENKKLQELFLTTEIEDLIKIFPGRSADAIKRKAAFYGLHKERKHTYAKRRNKTV